MKSARWQSVAVLGAVVLSLAVAGCGSVRAQTQQGSTLGDGVSGEAGDISLRNVVVVATDSGDASTVLASFANRGADDELDQVRVNGSIATPTGGSLDLPAGGFASLGPDSTRLDVGGADTVPGRFVEVQFVFAEAPRVTVDALVQTATRQYENALIAPRGPEPSP
ncbi:MAG: hypothetical protein ACRDWI_11465 [Jiangellaceae bacterium]